MATRASDLAEQAVSASYCFGVCARRRLDRNRQRSLKYAGRRDLADQQFVRDSVLIRIGVQAEPFDRLHAVMLAEGVDAKLTHRTHRTLAREGFDDQVGVDTFNTAGVDRTVGVGD